MQNEWILDVLTDLRTFAHQNGLTTLAEHLDDTRLVAASSLTSTGEGLTGNECRTAQAAGHDTRGAGTRL